MTPELLFTQTFLLWIIVILFTLFSTISLGVPNPDYLSSTNYPRMIRDRYCGAYTVWHTLKYYGIDKNIDLIIEDMQLDKEEGSSMSDIVLTLRKYGLSSDAVKLRIDNIATLKQPYIPYIPSSDITKPGHFIFCLPIGKNKAIILDGREKPSTISLDLLTEESYRAGWDGTSILLRDKKYAFFPIWKVFNKKTYAVTSIFLLIVLVFISGKYCYDKKIFERRSPMN
ncbi:hypothetical protein KAR91_00200 [Candidatus Pacearchaeota archaeon]|nr:hypothetical protein [Candidatus Pacearchaeota archaeon]